MASKSTSADDVADVVVVDAVAVPTTVHAVAVPVTADAVALPIKTAADYSAEELAAAVVYQDNVFTSRSLVMPGGRLLQVSKGRVSVKVIDAQARAYLDEHPDLEPLLE